MNEIEFPCHCSLRFVLAFCWCWASFIYFQLVYLMINMVLWPRLFVSTFFGGRFLMDLHSRGGVKSAAISYGLALNWLYFMFLYLVFIRQNVWLHSICTKIIWVSQSPQPFPLWTNLALHTNGRLCSSWAVLNGAFEMVNCILVQGDVVDLFGLFSVLALLVTYLHCR